MAKLNALQVKNAKPGRHGDGAGLYLLVKPSGSKSWVLRVQRDGRRRDVGLGSLAALSLSEAREKAAELRKHALNGRDPIAERDRDRRPAPTFREAVKYTHEQMKAGWVDKNAAAFLTSLETYAYPALGNLRVDTIEAAHIRDMLAPIWTTKPELARKVRMRVGQVLNFSHSKGWRSTEAPGKTVSIGLPKQPKGKNYLAMPYADVPGFVQQLRSKAPTQGRQALQLLILTASRSGEIRRGRWGQVDRAKRLWNRPADIMKERIAHSVTLNKPALALLAEITEAGGSTKPDALFFANRHGEPISDMTMNKVLRDAGLKWNVHGFRSSFRDWAAEQMPEIPDPVVEAALAHEVPDKVVRAYKRTNFLEMRRKLLDAWGEFLDQSSLSANA
ncbi:integrase arm-type DNA-binding domain-containing protein [Altererythrobacter aerius]|uniref:Integrase arm-type DNA-binding domain-containing protein n=1 Tax=Tsuneonella aeria TaxID=1837929 RepID=A0A6I4TDM2_9SPHN|nr:integrase arm-type DNA-binding domain-containing protein [Tsuneonella aeria]MXO75332.1 integrase arm-type DNA-binding domain-containing protein [Tsuneonella aeria]